MPKFIDVIREETEKLLTEDKSVILIGEGVPDPKAIFGSTKGLKEKFPDQVFDMPVSENGMTGICIGAAVTGLKPILVHQRIDFSLYAMDQLINNAAKWHSMFGGRAGTCPLTIRAIIGKGWGQGNQHSQNLAHIYAMFPGLKVVYPSNPKDARTLLRDSVLDPNPVLYIEHRWLHNIEAEEQEQTLPIGKARIVRSGRHSMGAKPDKSLGFTIVAYGPTVIDAIKLHDVLEENGQYCEVIDLRTIRPLDMETVKMSVRRTGYLICLEEAWEFGSLSAEIIAQCAEDRSVTLKVPPLRVTLPNSYAPSSPHLSYDFYPDLEETLRKILQPIEWRRPFGEVLTVKQRILERFESQYKTTGKELRDVPDTSFKGPF